MIGSVSTPAKRRRTHPDNPDQPLCCSQPPSTLPPPTVKRERSLSSEVERRLVTSGVKRFTPIPSDCLPSCTEYRQNRLEWVVRCAKELEALNLVPERRLFREDGLVIDWRSHVPVWSDTLKPDPQDLAATIVLAHRSNALWHPPSVRKESPRKFAFTQERPLSASIYDAEPPLKKRLPVPPRPSSTRRNNSSQLIPVNMSPSGPGSSSPHPERPRLSGETDHENYSPSCHRPSSLSSNLPPPVSILMDVSSRHGQFGISSEPSSEAGDQSVTANAPSAAEEEMSEMTLTYLRRYIQTYESDRASLASAYANNASFGYRIHHIVHNIIEGSSSVLAISPQFLPSDSKRTRLDIVTTLLALPQLHTNTSNSGIARIEYDIFYLGARLGMFVVCRTVDANKTVVHNFILQRKEVDVEDAVVEGIWPLTATAHQILVFQA